MAKPMLKLLQQLYSIKFERIFSSIADWEILQPVVYPPNFDIFSLLKKAVNFDHDGYTEMFEYDRLNIKWKAYNVDINLVQVYESSLKMKQSHIHEKDQ